MEILTPEPQIFYEYILEFEYDGFSILYNQDIKEWTAVSHDEEVDEIIIIKDSKNPLTINMELFNGYILTVEEFHRLEKMVNEQET